MARPCRQFGCPKLVNSKAERGYCDDHAGQRSNWNKRQDRQGSTTQRGYGWTWQQLRERILKRDDYLCQSCLLNGVYEPARHVDHIISKAKGGIDDPGNLQSLCVSCHETKTATEKDS